MKTLKHRPPGLFEKGAGIAAIILLLMFLLPGTALANMAANAVITNTATVNYDDTGGNAQAPVADSVDVTVNLVTAHPTFNAPTPADQTTPSGISVDYLYTITSNSNGLDTYSLTSGTSAVGANITLGTIVFRDAADAGDITDIDLGATTVAAAAIAGATAITVPNDGVADGSINGIDANAGTNTVVIGGTTYTVASIVDNATGTSTINLSAGLAAPVAVGDLISQQRQFILRTGTATTTVSGQTYTITVTADDGVTAGAAPTDDTITTVTLISLSVTKYVQNVDNIQACGGAFVNVNTGLGAGLIDYCDSGVTGNPGEELEYVIVITNAAGSGQATDVIISDPVPNFTTVSSNIALDPGTGVWSNVATTADNGDFGEADATTVYIYAGSGGTDAAAGVGAGTGGTLNASTTTQGAFRVTITP
ncbi:hypothetical protein [Kaarinaea lacus]